MLLIAYIFIGLFILYGDIACATEVNNRIVNGFVADRHNFPYQVSLQINNNLYCGGVILDKWHVLTAAHCVDGYNVRLLSVLVGSADLRSSVGSRHLVSAMKIHEKYQTKDGWPNDIALLRLGTPLVFNKFVRPAVLPERGEDWRIGQSAVVSGFGQTNTNSPLSPILYKTQVFIESNAECQRQYYSDRIRPTNICTRHPNKFTGFCRGDSGGPLNVMGKVAGLVSFSMHYGCASPAKTPQVYTRLSAYVDWINYWRNQRSYSVG